MKRQSTLVREQLLRDLNMLERKNKRNGVWDKHVKMVFSVTGSYSFDELVIKGAELANNLVVKFK